MKSRAKSSGVPIFSTSIVIEISSSYLQINFNKKRCRRNFPINNVHKFTLPPPNSGSYWVNFEENLPNQITFHAYFNFPSIELIHLTMDLCCQTTDSHCTNTPNKNKAIAFLYAIRFFAGIENLINFPNPISETTISMSDATNGKQETFTSFQSEHFLLVNA